MLCNPDAYYINNNPSDGPTSYVVMPTFEYITPVSAQSAACDMPDEPPPTELLSVWVAQVTAQQAPQ